MDINAPGMSYLEPDIGAEFVPPIPAHPRERIVALCRHCTNRLIGRGNLLPYEYWSFASVATDEMADVLLQMKMRHPYTLSEAVRETGLDEEPLERLLDEMSYIGLLEYNWENPTRTKQWVLPMLVPGSAEFLNMRLSQIDEHPIVAKFFEQSSKGPLSRATPMVPPGGAGIGMHVIPVERAIETENRSVSVEHIEHWLDKYEGKYAASPCSCRMSRNKLGEGCGDDPRDWCIAVGDMADYIVETDRGRYIDRDEVMAILKRAEDNGFVHQITNIDGENKIFAICNCNVNVCYALRTSQLFNTPNLSRSAYVARVDARDCVACGRCVEVCPAGAVKLGQKLCLASTGAAPDYPKQELPDAVKWGPERWSPDYRNRNRIETYDTGTAPCKTACPAHIAVQGYLKLAAQGRYREALALIKRENPLPAVCGRICNRACEDACTRGGVDAAIAIDEVKKFIAQQDLDACARFIPPTVAPTTGEGFEERVAIVGAGPAGLSCAYYLAEKGYHPVVFERSERPGGMLTYGVPSYKLEKDVIAAEVDVIREMGAEIRCGVEVGRDVSLADLRAQGFKAFYLAIGCQAGRSAGIAGEDAEGVSTAVAFLRSVSSGELDALSGRTVVVGGGNVAIDVARSAARLGSASVSMLCLESAEEMPASDEEVACARADGVEIACGWGPAEILTDGDRVRGVRFKRCTRVFDDEGRFAPVYDEAETKELECDRVVLSIGQAIEWGDLLADSAVKLGRGQGPLCDPKTYQTDEPDIFVGGDVHTGPKFAIDAIAAGHEAAISIHRFVQHATLTIGRNPRVYRELDKARADVGEYDRSTRQAPAIDGERERSEPFREYVRTLSEEQVRIETARCLGCGASVVDENKCIGCGLCTTKCDFDAIHLHREHPEASRMVKYEKKLPTLLKYAIKREIKIRFGAKAK
ncbi:FAD-dependent pyridine nucleotide-disulfide oxidoreductase [Coriobacterium glomerans PW2]|uniref:FAD-dependent pyridine nucleotide-disulfide oxidoreductase n=1 Tax=Coriobacterium glomerans (strain ATCC 49209 / DSM 20642 / JCM 10262 / PW2) TaxID=700015 RepID=F2NA89_CORGP|nr:FAD-dependent pyridine nucleotide-disulfide oxidoreductase [Coriobacterium glomerans PW2]